jgi:division/cell wall cluster transcriptional repressor MraZ
MAVLFGEFETTIDGKHRLAISSEFRQQMLPEDGDGFILTLGPDRHLRLYPDAYYRRLMATLRRSPLPTRAAGKLTVFFATARPVKTDAQGRVVIPETSMGDAIIADDVTIIANDDHLEIWPRDEWKKFKQASLPTYGEVLYEAADRLGTDCQEPQPGIR